MDNKFMKDVNEEFISEVKKFIADEDLLIYLSQIFKALSDPTRLKIIYALSKGDLCVSDLSDLLNMSQSSISHQLALLRSQELIKAKRVGRLAIYSLDDDHVLSIFNQGKTHAEHKKSNRWLNCVL